MTVTMDNYSVFFRLVLSNGLLFRSSLFLYHYTTLLTAIQYTTHTKHGALACKVDIR